MSTDMHSILRKQLGNNHGTSRTIGQLMAEYNAESRQAHRYHEEVSRRLVAANNSTRQYR